VQSKMSVIHEGINTAAIAPNADAVFVTASGKTLRAGQKVVTFVARNLEPYRGFHIFMRAIPEIQRRHPDAEILIVGSEGVSYGRKLPEGDSYKKRLLAEVAFNPDTVHFTGSLQTEQFRQIMQVSAAHVYLTYPFVLSWSMLEAMSAGCLVIGSRTAPVEEVIVDGRNGILVDFLDINGLADITCEALARPERFVKIRKAARATVLARYDLETVALPRQIALLDDLIRRS
jgi:glycosyltransferase involved in cell wall biosynthesis